METLKISNILSACEGKLVQEGIKTEFNNVSTDTRSINKDDLFVALKGERFDAHDFVQDAYKTGCRLFMVHKNVNLPPDASVVYVDDTLKALGDLAGYYRRFLGIKVIGITGSNGKTTTKDILGNLLSHEHKIAITQGTMNNLVGLPLTIFSANKSHEFLVVELGINHFGEMDMLASIAKPDIAVITNIGPSHVEFLIDEEGVCKAKSEVFPHIAENGIAVLNKNDKFFDKLKNNSNCNVITFGIENKADYCAKNLVSNNNGISLDIYVSSEKSVSCTLPLFGEHNVLNFLASIAVAHQLGISLDSMTSVIPKIKPPKMRMEILNFPSFTIINDAYNANPLSTLSALKELDKINCSGKKIFIFADMLELGDKGELYHREIGKFINNSTVGYLITIGGLAKYTAEESSDKNVKTADSVEECFNYLKEILSDNDVVMIKGSRSNKLEKIVEMLKQN